MVSRGLRGKMMSLMCIIMIRRARVSTLGMEMHFTFGRCPGSLSWQPVMSRFAIIKEFLEFLRERKKWWIAPIVIFLLLLGGLLIFAKGSALAPFIYSLF
jgi:hypothetical protein